MGTWVDVCPEAEVKVRVDWPAPGRAISQLSPPSARWTSARYPPHPAFTLQNRAGTGPEGVPHLELSHHWLRLLHTPRSGLLKKPYTSQVSDLGWHL